MCVRETVKVAHAFDPSAWEAEAVRPLNLGQGELYQETMSQTVKKKMAFKIGVLVSATKVQSHVLSSAHLDRQLPNCQWLADTDLSLSRHYFLYVLYKRFW